MLKRMICPWCGENHDVTIITEEINLCIKGEIVTYNDTIYYCSNDNDYFVPDDVMDENLNRAKQAYRQLKQRKANNEQPPKNLINRKD